MTKSILQEEKECYVCHNIYGLHLHHIFYGTANRKKSDEDGCVVWLCHTHHTDYECGVHGLNKKLDTQLKQKCQTAWEQKHGTREEFRKRYGKSYL